MYQTFRIIRLQTFTEVLYDFREPEFATIYGKSYLLAEVAERAIHDGVTPGLAWAVVSRSRVLTEGVAGSYVYPGLGSEGVAGGPEVAVDTVWDLASVTKVVSASAIAMVLWQDGLLDLDSPVADLVSDFGNNGDQRRQSATVEMLLLHTAGLPPHVRLWERATAREGIVAEACRVPLVADPGTVTEYSDVGFLVLGEVLERVAGERMDTYVQRRVWGPLGMRDTCYCPAPEWKGRCAPTNAGTDFRRRVIQGEVHDENAAAMGGVAAHAGVFSTVGDMGRFAQCMLRGGEDVFRPETVEYFTRRRGKRALGWDMVNPPNSSAGRHFSQRSYGHLGYTGTSLWIDPEADLAVVLLTNRVWPDSRNQKIKEFRARFHDAVREGYPPPEICRY